MSDDASTQADCHPDGSGETLPKEEVVAALDDLEDVVYIADARSRIRFANAAVERMFGLLPAECIGGTLRSLAVKVGVAPEGVERLARAYSEAVGRMEPTVRFEALRSVDGRGRSYEVLERVLYGVDGKYAGARGVIRDVSDQRAIEGELRSSTLLHSRIVQHSPIGIAVLDRELRFLAVSDQYLADQRLAEADVVGRSYREVFPFEGDRWVTVFARCLSGAAERADDDVLVRADGSVDHVRWECWPWTDAHDQIAGVILWIEVTTAREHLAQRVLHAHKLESMARLAGGVAHDFNNLLTGVLGYAELTQESMHPDDPNWMHIEQIRRAAQRAAGITAQMLAVARRQAVTPSTVDLDAALRSLEPPMARMLGADVRLMCRLDAGLWPIRIDPSGLEQALLNLAVNARDAMPMGGELSVEAENADLEEPAAARAACVAPGRYVRIRVRDTGVGMPHHVLSRAFDPFFSTKEVGRGPGLGLSTCHGIVAQAGGAVAISSAPGEGTEVTLLLPVAGGGEAHAPEFRIVPGGGVAGTVLLIEDDDLVRSVAEESLQAAGFRVLPAASAAEARAVAERKRCSIDLAIVDLVLPDGSGVETVARIAGGANMPVLYISGRAEGEAPPGPLLAKPFTPRALLQAVARAMADL
ncbi:MAG TPA: PAS domain-containing protein [Chthonomonadales bacterium]|nr:PAS domain-containing protein [Chthonomonadales bacterium]